MSLYCKSCAMLFDAKRGLFVHIKILLLLSTLMTGSTLMAGMLQQVVLGHAMVDVFSFGSRVHLGLMG